MVTFFCIFVKFMAIVHFGFLMLCGAGRSFLIITNDMRDAFVPGNVRAADLAKTLRADGGNGNLADCDCANVVSDL